MIGCGKPQGANQTRQFMNFTDIQIFIVDAWRLKNVYKKYCIKIRFSNLN